MDSTIKKMEINLSKSIDRAFTAISLPHNRILFSYISNQNEKMLFYSFEETDWKQFDSNWDQIDNNHNKIVGIQRCNYLIDNRGHLQQYLMANLQNNHRLDLFDSPKYGKEWNYIRTINEESQHWSIFGRPLILQQGIWMGRILCPIYDQSMQRVFCLYSQDNGVSFNQGLFIEPFEVLAANEKNENLENSDEMELSGATFDPIIVECLDDLLRCFCRQKDHPGIFMAESYDYGDTWEEIQEVQSLKLLTLNQYDIITLKRTNGELSNILICLAVEQRELHKRLVLYATDAATIEFEEKLCIKTNVSEIFALQLLQDENGMIHIIYALNASKIIHLSLLPTALDLN